MLLAALLGQWGLHQVYGGEETFLYALHWVPLLVLVAAAGTLTRWRPLALGLAAVVLVGAGVNNRQQFRYAVQFAKAHAIPAETEQSVRPPILEPAL